MTRLRFLVAIFVFSSLLVAAAGIVQADSLCAVVDVDRVGPAEMNRLKSTAGVERWVELGDRLMVCGSWALEGRLRASRRLLNVHGHVDIDNIYAAIGHGAPEITELGGRHLMDGSRLLVAMIPNFVVHEIDEKGDEIHLYRIEGNTVLVSQLANAPTRVSQALVPGIQALVDEVDEDRWFADVEALAAIDRYSHNPGIVVARDWLIAEFGQFPGVTVSTPQFMVSSTQLNNVIATLTGTSRPDDWYIVGGHYDSTSELSPQPSLAPGAEDNASGCAGVLEIARILTAHPPEGTMIFMCYSGEEQGFYGSIDHATDLVAAGDDSKVKAVLDMDMIGYSADSSLDCLLETNNGVGLPLLTVFSDASAYTSLEIHTTTFAWGSDHVPYLDRGMPALLTIENDYGSYPGYHRTTDTTEKIVLAMGREILKMNVAAMATLAGASSSLLFSDDFESGGTTSWTTQGP